MRKLLVLAAAAGALSLGACATNGGYAGGGYGYDYASGAYDYAGPADVWYDGYYGPYVDGYWASGGQFFYKDSRGGYHRDSSRHFQNHEFSGGQHLMAGHRPRK